MSGPTGLYYIQLSWHLQKPFQIGAKNGFIVCVYINLYDVYSNNICYDLILIVSNCCSLNAFYFGGERENGCQNKTIDSIG